MARGGIGLPKISPGPTMPYPSIPCGWATGPSGQAVFGRLLPLWTPHAVTSMTKTSSDVTKPASVITESGTDVTENPNDVTDSFSAAREDFKKLDTNSNFERCGTPPHARQMSPKLRAASRSSTYVSNLLCNLTSRVCSNLIWNRPLDGDPQRGCSSGLPSALSLDNMVAAHMVYRGLAGWA
jgi:hypothetical protein